MAESLPFLPAPGIITTVLSKIQPAQTPDIVDAKFLEERLGLKGGSYRSFLPFARRIGLISPEGAPTELYRRFRGEGHSSQAIAEAMRIGYSPLFAVNESVHTLPSNELRKLVIQITGWDAKSSSIDKVMGCFTKLKEWARFDGRPALKPDEPESEPSTPAEPGTPAGLGRLHLSYTINLNLPESTDPKVFHAIFKALKEHLLSE